MKKQSNTIFSSRETPNREETQRWLDGKGDAALNRKMEEQLAEDDLTAEGLDGLSADPGALSVLPDNLFKTNTHASKGTSIYKILFWPTLAIACISIVVLVANQSEKSNEKTAHHTPLTESGTPITSSTEIDQKEIDDAEPISEPEQITYAKTKADQPKTVILQKTEVEINPVKENEALLTPVETKKADNIESGTDEKYARSNVRFTYFNDLKVIDYGDLYTTDIKKTEIVLTGTPANIGDASTTNTEVETRTVYIPYEKFLRESMGEFSRNQYKTALKNYITIIQHYPDDLNAHFYGGLCYYNLGKFDKAIQSFDKCIHNAFSTFEEEAEWYKALSLIKLSKKENAKELLQIIIAKKGFYSERASKQLAELN